MQNRYVLYEDEQHVDPHATPPRPSGGGAAAAMAHFDGVEMGSGGGGGKPAKEKKLSKRRRRRAAKLDVFVEKDKVGQGGAKWLTLSGEGRALANLRLCSSRSSWTGLWVGAVPLPTQPQSQAPACSPPRDPPQPPPAALPYLPPTCYLRCRHPLRGIPADTTCHALPASLPAAALPPAPPPSPSPVPPRPPAFPCAGDSIVPGPALAVVEAAHVLRVWHPDLRHRVPDLQVVPQVPNLALHDHVPAQGCHQRPHHGAASGIAGNDNGWGHARRGGTALAAGVSLCLRRGSVHGKGLCTQAPASCRPPLLGCRLCRHVIIQTLASPTTS